MGLDSVELVINVAQTFDWKLASYEVAGIVSGKFICPERTMDSAVPCGTNFGSDCEPNTPCLANFRLSLLGRIRSPAKSQRLAVRQGGWLYRLAICKPRPKAVWGTGISKPVRAGIFVASPPQKGQSSVRSDIIGRADDAAPKMPTLLKIWVWVETHQKVKKQ